MMATYNLLPNLATNEEIGFDWDIVSYPVADEGFLQAVPGSDINWFGISSVTDHPEEAFEVVQYLLSEDFQRKQVEEEMMLTSLTNKELNEGYGKEHEAYDALKDKNLDALWSSPFHRFQRIHLFGIASLKKNVWEEQVMPYAVDTGQDIHSILRNLSEEAEIEVEKAKGSR